jgi:uncharacterized GH25 family protein
MSKTLPILVCACCLSWAKPASAHEFWLQPSTYRPAIGQDVSVGVSVGDVFYQGIHALLTDEDIVKFVANGPTRQTPVAAKVGNGPVGKGPVGKIALSTPGVYILEFTDLTRFSQLDPPTFERYLQRKGLEQVIAARKQRGESDQPGREAWSHSLKTIVVAGDPSREIRDHALGLPLEIVCESRLDARRPGDALSFKVLYHGAPAKGVLVTATRRHAPIDRPRDRLFMRTDANGRVEFTLDTDVWLIDAVHMVDAPAGLKASVVPALAGSDGGPQAARWRSFWSSLTFELSPRQ